MGLCANFLSNPAKAKRQSGLAFSMQKNCPGKIMAMQFFVISNLCKCIVTVQLPRIHSKKRQPGISSAFENNDFMLPIKSKPTIKSLSVGKWFNEVVLLIVFSGSL